jgi:hypothetical protein
VNAAAVPANLTAIIQVSPRGQELKCVASMHALPMHGKKVPRGVMSYYAARALPQATSVQDWLQRMTALMQADARQGVLPRCPAMTITGRGSASLPGTAAGSSSPVAHSHTRPGTR